MAQARVKSTGEVVELLPGSKDGRFCMQDIKTGKFYNWDQLEKVTVKTGVAPVVASAIQINVSPSVTGNWETSTQTSKIMS